VVTAGATSLRIASRGSPLALWQAHAVRDALTRADPDLEVEIKVVRTTGDRVADVPLSQIGDRGLFTKEIDGAVLDGAADVAVHSLKDVPTAIADDLALVAVTRREDPRDVLICGPGAVFSLESLPTGARIGTGSLRRRAQLRARRPDLAVEDLRGNLNTRLARLDQGDYDAILLAAAGVIRLGWQDRVSEWLDPAEWLPAVGQGALAIVARADDARTAERIAPLHHVETGCAVAAERSLLRDLEGGCQIPIGGLATVSGDTMRLVGLVADLEGKRVLRHELEGPVSEPEGLGHRVAAALREKGAQAILDEIRAAGAIMPAPAP
jgi:hydroxymethylbilane synthase